MISRHVTSLFYEPDTLQKYYTQEEWEDNIVVADWMDRIPASPMPGASEREHREYRRDCKKLMHQPRHLLSEEELSAAHAAYKTLYEEQKSHRLEGYGAQALADALSGFQNLVDVCMSMGYNVVDQSNYIRRAFGAGLQIPWGDQDSIVFGPGVCQVRSILFAVRQAGIQLRQLKIGNVDWKFFKARQSDMEEMKKSMRSVRDLELGVSTGHTKDEDELGLEIPECREYLENNSLYEFLKASPDLEILSVLFDWFEPYCPADLKQVVGNSTWPRLRNVSFEHLDVDVEDLDAFFECHCSSLYTLNLITIRLLRGRWAEVLERMHATLTLKSAYVGRELLGEDPYQSWNLEPSFLVEDDDLSDQSNRTRKPFKSTW